jgi:hypothetical protein
LAAGQIGSIVERGIEAAKFHSLRKVRRNPGLENEQRTDQHQGAQRGLTHGIDAAFGFFGQRRYSIEAEEREHGN